MKETMILKGVKYMLSDRCSHAVIRITIMLLENNDRTTPEKPIIINDKSAMFSRYFDDVGKKEFVSNIVELSVLTNPALTVTLLKQNNDFNVFELKCVDIAVYFATPIKMGSFVCLKIKDKLQNNVNLVWKRWCEKIGSRKDIYRNGCPSLTQKRRKSIENILSIHLVDFMYLVIEGTIRSPYHMGFLINKSGLVTKQTKYCCVTTIFRNTHVMEALATKAEDRLYYEQIEEADNKINLRNFGKASVHTLSDRANNSTTSKLITSSGKMPSLLEQVLNAEE